MGHHEHIGHLAYGGILIGVDGHDEVLFFHPGKMLDGYGNAACHVELGLKMKKRTSREKNGLSRTDKLVIPQRNAAVIVDTVFATLKNTLINGEPIKLVQFGSLNVRYKSPRRGRNPKTGESMVISKRQMITFRPSRQLRERLNEPE